MGALSVHTVVTDTAALITFSQSPGERHATVEAGVLPTAAARMMGDDGTRINECMGAEVTFWFLTLDKPLFSVRVVPGDV